MVINPTVIGSFGGGAQPFSQGQCHKTACGVYRKYFSFRVGELHLHCPVQLDQGSQLPWGTPRGWLPKVEDSACWALPRMLWVCILQKQALLD